MAYSDPLAFFLTWSTYGTWLPGDERGWVDTGKGYQLPSPELVDRASLILNENACYLDSAERQIVEKQVAETCSHRGWRLHAVNCRSNHVHVVVTARDLTSKKVLDDLKAWCTRGLKERSDASRLNWWTEGGSKQQIFTEIGLYEVIVYVLVEQDRKGRS